MNEHNIESKLIKALSNKRKIDKPFEDIVSGFDRKLDEFYPVSSCFYIEPYFGTGKGHKTSIRLLTSDDKISVGWLREYETKNGNTKKDFKGIYVFVHEKTPFYVGISKGVIGRLHQHVKGKSHNTSTLAFKIGLERYKLINGYAYDGKRKDLNYESEVEPVKEFLMKQKVAFIPINDDDELALFEIYCSMKLGTNLNSFETH